MQAVLLAVVHPDNTPHGYNLTFAFPMLMFIIVAGALYLLFRRPHSVPGHVALASSRWAKRAAPGSQAAAIPGVEGPTEPREPEPQAVVSESTEDTE